MCDRYSTAYNMWKGFSLALVFFYDAATRAPRNAHQPNWVFVLIYTLTGFFVLIFYPNWVFRFDFYPNWVIGLAAFCLTLKNTRCFRQQKQ
jgi:hypothetical protein